MLVNVDQCVTTNRGRCTSAPIPAGAPDFLTWPASLGYRLCHSVDMTFTEDMQQAVVLTLPDRIRVYRSSADSSV